MKSYLTLLLLFSFIAIQSLCAIVVSPFDYSSIYTPAGMYRMSSTLTLTGTSSNFPVTYTKSYTNTPIILYSVASMTFNRGIKYNLTIVATTSTALTANFQFDSTVSKVSFLFMALDSTLYSANFSFFTYAMPVGANTAQTIAIVGNELHDASFLVQLQATLGPFPSGFAPQVDSYVLVDTSSIISANLSFTYDPSQLAIKSLTMYFVDFQQASFKAPPYAGIGQQFAIYGTNGIATDVTQTGTYISSYSNSYFTGLQALFDGQFLLGTLSFDIIAMLNTNIYYAITQLLFVAYKCPGSFPYTAPGRTYCYNDCDIGFYADDQAMCQPCDSNCYTCFNMSTNCTSCVSPYVLVYGYVCACNQYSYQITNANGSLSCLLCSSSIYGCWSCTSSTNCTDCMSNLILTSPIDCICPPRTAPKTIGTLIICVQVTSIVNTTDEICPTGMLMNYTTCTCPSELNLTFANGVCY